MTTNTVKILDETDAQLFLSPLWEKKYKRESFAYNTYLPTQAASISSSSTVQPDMLTFNLPNTGMINVAESFYTFKHKLSIGTLSENDTVYQLNGVIYKGSATVVQQLPVSARSFIQQVQVLKDNVQASRMDFTQKRKHRDVVNYSLCSQDYINSFPDYVLLNDTTRVLYKCTTSGGETGVYIYLTFTVPFAELSPLFSVYPYYPMGLLNTPLTINIWPNVDTSAAYAAFSDYQIRLGVYSNPGLLDVLRTKPIYGTFNDYFLHQGTATTRAGSFHYEVDQTFKSLDMIDVRAFKTRSNALYRLGYSSIEDNLATFTDTTMGNIQVQYNNVNLFTRQFNNLNDIMRMNAQNGNQTTNFGQGAPFYARPENALKYQNAISIKLDDNTGSEGSSCVAGYTGISVRKENNLILDFDMYIYSAKTQNSVKSEASDAINFDVTMYYSNMFQITKTGDLIVAGQAGSF